MNLFLYLSKWRALTPQPEVHLINSFSFLRQRISLLKSSNGKRFRFKASIWDVHENTRHFTENLAHGKIRKARRSWRKLDKISRSECWEYRGSSSVLLHKLQKSKKDERLALSSSTRRQTTTKSVVSTTFDGFWRTSSRHLLEEIPPHPLSLLFLSAVCTIVLSLLPRTLPLRPKFSRMLLVSGASAFLLMRLKWMLRYQSSFSVRWSL